MDQAVFGIIGVGGIAQSQHLPNLTRAPHWNYMVDKGWLSAVDHFAECVLNNTPPQTACAEDGLWASRMSAAAIRSRESGEVVRF